MIRATLIGNHQTISLGQMNTAGMPDCFVREIRNGKPDTMPGLISCQVPMAQKGAKTWDEWRAQGHSPYLQQPSAVDCGGMPGGETLIPYIAEGDPRARLTSLGIMLFFPTLIWNHYYNRRFSPKGSLLTSPKHPVVIAFPLGAKVVTDEMIDLAIDLIKSGQLDKVSGYADNTFFEAISKMSDYGEYGNKIAGPVGGVIGAWIGGLAAWFSGVFGKQEWDIPEELESYGNKNHLARMRAGVKEHYGSEAGSGQGCNVLTYPNATAPYTLQEGVNRLIQKIKASKGIAPPSPTPATRTGPSPAQRPQVPRRAPVCTFETGGKRFRCTQKGFLLAQRAAIQAGAPLLFRRGRSRISLRSCAQRAPIRLRDSEFGVVVDDAPVCAGVWGLLAGIGLTLGAIGAITALRRS